jgi:hypothetical protein
MKRTVPLSAAEFRDEMTLKEKVSMDFEVCQSNSGL